ncbi:FlgK family flagellar hook-associated protein [Lyticum sinuosum]|uniref:Flagellar hook-associated protein 1 n=1 Tax=Lyticum sinuosum TaxID=1332059 RepID=A0AAE5AHT2_9RICK|nr:hypothetical protein [Lyticum sinuosum]MDZ5761356.1 flagellar hook-associated protein FlgK [Lyticum sinuosum]
MTNKIDITSLTNNALYNITQESYAVQHNIANINLENAVRVNVEQKEVAGLNIPVFLRDFDKLKTAMLYEKNSEVNTIKIISDYYEQISNIMDSTTSDIGILASFQKFFQSINNYYTTDNESAADDTNILYLVLESAKDIAFNISDTQKQLMNIIDEVSSDLETSINQVNNIIHEIYEMNVQKLMVEKNSLSYTSIEESINQKLIKLSEFFSFSTYEDSKGFLNIIINNGGYKIVGEQEYFIKYKNESAIDMMNSNKSIEFSKISIVPINVNKLGEGEIILVNSGYGDQCSSKVSQGKISGLLDLRDDIIPSILSKLDNLAYILSDSINSCHNKGTSLINNPTLTGTHNISLDELIHAKGVAYISLVDKFGVTEESRNIGKIPTIDLQFETIAESSSNIVNIQSIIDEIKSLGNKESCISYGDTIYDLQLASLTQKISEFDLDITVFIEDPQESITNNLNYNENPSFILESAIIYDKNGNIIPSYVNGLCEMKLQGGRQRSSFINGPKIVIDNLAVNQLNESNYPLKVEVKTNLIENRINKKNDIIFEIPFKEDSELSINGRRNDRFYATNVIDKDGNLKKSNQNSIILDNDNENMIEVNLVDSDDYPANNFGFLQIKSLSSNSGIIINSDNSLLNGYTDGKINKKDRNFSDFFGLNDLFLINDPSQKAEKFNSIDEIMKFSAKNIRIRDDIKKNPNMFALAKASSTNNSNVFFYTDSDIEDDDMIEVYNKMYQKRLFDTGVPYLNSGTLFDNIIFFNSSITKTAASTKGSYDRKLKIYIQIDDDLQNQTGIDFNEELSKFHLLSKLQDVNISIQKMENRKIDSIIDLLRFR